MGPNETTLGGMVVYNSETGERVMWFDLASCPDITCETVVADPTIRHGWNDMSFEASFEWKHPHYSRRRFVKKLMGLGISRNAANYYARVCAKAKHPYGEAYDNIVFYSLLG